MNHITERIKAFVEKWQHRLQGHIIISGKHMHSGVTFSFYATAIYTSDNGKWFADRDDGITLPLTAETADYTITGA